MARGGRFDEADLSVSLKAGGWRRATGGLCRVQEQLEIVLRIRKVGTDIEGFPKVTDRGGHIPRRSERDAQVVVRVSVIRVDRQCPLELADRLRKLDAETPGRHRSCCALRRNPGRGRLPAGIQGSLHPLARQRSAHSPD